MFGAVSLARQLAQTLVGALALFVRDVRHDLSHLHRLTGWHVLNADDNLVIGRSRRVSTPNPAPNVGAPASKVLL